VHRSIDKKRSVTISDQEPSPNSDDSKLKQRLAQREAELAIINSVQQGLASHLEVQAIYDLVGDKICDIFGAQVVMISTYDPQTETIEHRYAIERGERVYAPGQLPIRGFRTQIVQTRQPVLVNTKVAELAARLGQPTLPGTITPKSWLGVPMIVGDHVTGILSLQHVEEENAFDEADVRFLQTLAASMSVALENANLFDETESLLKETEQRAAELQIINSVQAGLAQKLDMASIYELVGEKLQEIFPQADIAIGIYDPETTQFSAPFLIENGKRHTFKPFEVKGEGFISYLLRNPKSLLINEDMEQANLQYQNVDVTGKGLPKSALYVPLTMGSSMRGAIVLESMQKEHAFSQTDVRLSETLANSISVALENAHLWEQENLYRKALEREFEIGREIQAGFLPNSLPQPKGWEIAAILKSARVVAGDFYDVFELTEGKIGLVIADVCDKGLGAALFMTLFRSLIRMVSSSDVFSYAKAAGRISSAMRLKNTISLTNNYIEEIHGNTGMFATIFFGVLDTRTGILTFVNGGHLPPMLINEHGIKESLLRTGPAVGVISDADYTVREVAMEQGDIFFAYTDGLTDAENLPDELFSKQGLLPLFEGEQTLFLMLANIQKQIEKYSTGAQQTDDITMLAVRRNKK
jgi:serine phosphatase RsbU (regulator of sigma subunit)